MADEAFRETTWDEALDKRSSEIQRIQGQYGRDAFAIVSTGQIMTEEFYTLGKLARGVIGTNNYDGNTTLCMSSAVSGYKRSFGSDGPPGCYEDFEHTHCLLAFGSNLPEQHPIIYWRMQEAREKAAFPAHRGGPAGHHAGAERRHAPGDSAGYGRRAAERHGARDLQGGAATSGLHRSPIPGLSKPSRAEVEKFDPVTASKICGIDEDTIRNVARALCQGRRAMQIWTMGINQSTHGSDGVVAHQQSGLITGNIGKPGGTSLSITGQCNAMGTREWSSCSGLPGYRSLENTEHREDVAEFWNVDPEFFPNQRGMYQTDICPAMETGQIKGLWLIATNPMTVAAQYRAHPQGHGETGVLVRAGLPTRTSKAPSTPTSILPAGTWAEKEGVLHQYRAACQSGQASDAAPGKSKPDLWIFNRVAERFNEEAKLRFPETAADIFLEMGELSKGRLARHLRHEPRVAGDMPRRAMALHRGPGLTRRGAAQGRETPVLGGRHV